MVVILVVLVIVVALTVVKLVILVILVHDAFEIRARFFRKSTVFCCLFHFYFNTEGDWF